MNIKIQWDENANISNIETNGIDFIDAAKIFFKDRLEIEDKNYSDNKFIAIGGFEGIVILVSCELTQDGIRILSARRASRNERNLYADRVSGPNGAKPMGLGEGPQ